MKRIYLSLLVVLLCCRIAFAQSTSLTPMLNINGVLKKEFQNVAKGTPVVLQRIIKLKTIPSNGDSEVQAVILTNGIQFGLPVNRLDAVELHPETNDSFWQIARIYSGLISYYNDKGDMEELRQELTEESEKYLKELSQSKLLYEDIATEDYLQCILLSVVPEQLDLHKEVIPQIRILKSPSPDALMLSNQCLLVTTGLLTALDTEEELYAIIAREVAHQVLDHAVITTNKNITRAKRAEFWGAVANGVVAATEEILYQRYYNYEPGVIFATNDLIQSLVNEKINNRMGLDYSEKQEYEADEYALKFLEFSGKNKEALTSALTKIYSYYQKEQNIAILSKGEIFGSLEKRLNKLGTFIPLAKDPDYLKTMSTVVSFEAGMMNYNYKYVAAYNLAMKNIKNKMACPNDYIMVANSIMKRSNTRDSNNECMKYLNQAEALLNAPDLNVCKLKILLLLREKEQTKAIQFLHNYVDILEKAILNSHSEEQMQWLDAEQLWAENLIHRIELLAVSDARSPV